MAAAEAEALMALGAGDRSGVIVTAQSGWHPGVVGLVASRLKESFGRPAFAIALGPDGIGTGSGRSIPGVDLGRAVRRAVDEGASPERWRSRHGGRYYGVQGRLTDFRAFMEAALAETVDRARDVHELLLDGAVSARGVTTELAATLDRAGPFGSGNPEPLLALPSHEIAFVDPVGKDHLRVRLRSGDGALVNAVAFRAVGQPLGQALIENRGQLMHAAGSLSIDRWQGQERVQFRLVDLARPDQGPAFIR